MPTSTRLYPILKAKPFPQIRLIRTSDGGNGNHSVSLPVILIKNKVDQMLHLHI